MERNKLSGAVLACLFSYAACAADAPAGNDFIYQVKTGDNLGALSATLLDSPARWGEVARYNKLHNPNLIVPKQVLYIPLAWMRNYPAQASIEAVTGEVKLNGHAVHTGDVVAAGDKLETADAASVRMTLPDGSTLSLSEKTRLEALQLNKKTQGNFFTSLFRLTTGRIDALKKKYPDGQAPLRIEAMHGTIGVRGTHFRMAQEGENTLAEIEQGLVGFESGKSQLPLAGGQGSVADGVHVPSAITLLDAPTFPDMTQSFAPDALSFVMPTLAGAVAYRGELASDENFQNLVAPVSAQGSTIRIQGVSVGAYWLRLRAVDEHGLQGMPAQTALTVKIPPLVIPPPPPAELPIVQPSKPIVSGQHLLTGWRAIHGYRYEVQIARTADFSRPIFSVQSQKNYLTLTTPDKGDYFIRMRLLDAAQQYGHWCEPVAFSTE